MQGQAPNAGRLPITGQERRRALRRLRRSWQDSRPLVLAIATVVTVALGAWGWARVSKDYGWTDIAYRVPRLFAFTGGDVPPPVPWQLDVARFLAPLLAGYAAMRGLTLLLRRQTTALRLHLITRRHVLVCGLGRVGFRLAATLHERGFVVAVIESDDSNESMAGCAQRAIPVVIGDASDSAIQTRAAVRRASHVVACCGEDAVNLDVLGAMRAACAQSAGAATAHVQIRDHTLWRRLEAAALAEIDSSRVRTEFFSLHDLLARALVAHRLSPWKTPHDRPLRVLVMGEPRLLARVCAHVALRAAMDECALDLVIAPAAALADAEALEPGLHLADRVRAWQKTPSRAVASDGMLPEPIDRAFICIPDEGSSLAEALTLTALGPNT
ncbi:MAG: NAD(P)-binding protein, partial [Solirubrobacteraceae bacterium]